MRIEVQLKYDHVNILINSVKVRHYHQSRLDLDNFIRFKRMANV